MCTDHGRDEHRAVKQAQAEGLGVTHLPNEALLCKKIKMFLKKILSNILVKTCTARQIQARPISAEKTHLIIPLMKLLKGNV